MRPLEVINNETIYEVGEARLFKDMIFKKALVIFYEDYLKNLLFNIADDEVIVVISEIMPIKTIMKIQTLKEFIKGALK